MPPAPVSRDELVRQLHALGVRPRAVLLVHTAFSRLRPIEDGPAGLIAALQTAVGPQGTIVMPSMPDDDDHPFDPRATPCKGMGVVADTFWRLPGVLRSDSPHAFAARGPAAEAITTPHPVELPHGPDSPVGRVYDVDGQVLLLGVDHDSDTTVHLGEFLACVRYRAAKYAMVWREGRALRVDYDEIDHCCDNFRMVNGWLDENSAQRRGPIAHGEGRLARARSIVTAVTTQLRRDETRFLHPFGVDAECDAARRSLGQQPPPPP